jgi:hypothetical protein
MGFMATPFQVENYAYCSFPSRPYPSPSKTWSKSYFNYLSSYSHKWLCPGSAKEMAGCCYTPLDELLGWKQTMARLFDG